MKLALKLLGAGVALLVVAAGGFVFANRVPDRPVDALKARWAPPPSQFVAIAGMDIHLRDEGPRDDALPIVLLHGTSASLHTWDGWVGTLGRERRVIRYDLPGFGLTGPAPDDVYTIENYARVTVAVLDALGVQRCVLVGNSLGGYVAWATALLHPGRVERLVLVDAGGYQMPAAIPLGWRIARNPVLGPLLREVLPRRVVEDGLRKAYGDPSRVTPELVDRYLELTARAGNRRALAQRLRQMGYADMAGRVRELKLPTLILWGGRDALYPPAVGARFKADIAGSRLVVFDALGHVPQEEDPAATVAALQDFLAR